MIPGTEAHDERTVPGVEGHMAVQFLCFLLCSYFWVSITMHSVSYWSANLSTCYVHNFPTLCIYLCWYSFRFLQELMRGPLACAMSLYGFSAMMTQYWPFPFKHAVLYSRTSRRFHVPILWFVYCLSSTVWTYHLLASLVSWLRVRYFHLWFIYSSPFISYLW